jgi:molecular chaperone IbpA
MAMRTFDMTPLFRNSVGFDRMARLMDGVAADQVPTYPPYNIEKVDEDSYRITMAVAGFAEDDLDVLVKENQLTVTGRVQKTENEENDKQFLHRGIAERAFERRFNLADHIKVGGADLVNGLLHIDLVREVPEAMKPRTVAINNNLKAIGDKAA